MCNRRQQEAWQLVGGSRSEPANIFTPERTKLHQIQLFPGTRQREPSTMRTLLILVSVLALACLVACNADAEPFLPLLGGLGGFGGRGFGGRGFGGRGFGGRGFGGRGFGGRGFGGRGFRGRGFGGRGGFGRGFGFGGHHGFGGHGGLSS
ncbi:holotricin-3-like [Penaeus chinensis]|uniref:holotricin-3-like n=1 Tax=Penaeus chinensis TaxID=139456 RepID=UPI001FB6781E|nr:holotricin-3-like [Penaeus chinensis]